MVSEIPLGLLCLAILISVLILVVLEDGLGEGQRTRWGYI